MNWEPIGAGPKRAPYDRTDAAYVSYWDSIADCSRRHNNKLSPPRSRQPSDEPLCPQPARSISSVPNVHVFSAYCSVPDAGPEQLQLYYFIFGPQFATISSDSALLEIARRNISSPDRRGGGDHSLSSWCPLPLTDQVSNHYATLVLRIAFLTTAIDRTRRLLDGTHARLTPQARDTITRTQRDLLLWRDAHLFLTLAIDQLGWVPNERTGNKRDAAVWKSLLEHYSPDINMFFHVGELPVLDTQIVCTPFFSATLGPLNGADPIVNTFRKALPKRCATRESKPRESNHTTRSPAYFCFTKMLVAASLLGIYQRSVVAADWHLRRGVYELFFFRLDDQLAQFRVPRALDGLLSGSRQALVADYAFDRSAIDLSNKPSSARVQTASYEAAVVGAWVNNRRTAHKKATSAAAAAAASGVKKKTSANGNGAARKPRGRKTRELSAQAQVNVSAQTVVSRKSSAAKNSDYMRHSKEVRDAFAHGFAFSRLQREQTLGIDYYRQRRDAGTLPALHAGAAAGECAPEPRSRRELINDAYVARNVLPCDERVPAHLDADRIVFEWLHAHIEWTTERGKKTRNYIYQDFSTMATRALLIEQLNYSPGLRAELTARTDWAAWERNIYSMLDFMRHSLNVECARPSARPGAFLSTSDAFVFMHTSRTTPLNALYLVRRMPFMELVQLEAEKMLTARGGMDARADLVMPVEYPVLMRHCLYAYKYPRGYEQPAAADKPASALLSDDCDDTTMSRTVFDDDDDDDAVGGNVGSSSYTERVMTPLPVYTIAPCNQVPDDDATFDDCVRMFAKKGLFPGRAFRMAASTINGFNLARKLYASTFSVKHVTAFVASIASCSLFQLQLVLAFANAVNSYLNVFTFPLPRYLEEQHDRLLVSRYATQMLDDSSAPLPPHLTRSLVCLGCRRVAAFVATGRAKNLDTAYGTDKVRVSGDPIETRIIARVVKRGALLSPDQLRGEKTLHRAFQQRAIRSVVPYEDRYADDPIVEQERAEQLALCSPEILSAPTSGQERADVVEQLMRDALANCEETEEESEEEERALSDEDAHRAASDALCGPLHKIGAGSDMPLRDMILFDEKLWKEYNARAPLIKLVYGHVMQRSPTAEQRPVLVCTDNATGLKNERKKNTRMPARRAEIEMESDPAKRAHKMTLLNTSRRYNALALQKYNMCSREQMFSYDSRHALVAEQPTVAPRAHTNFYMHCLTCNVVVKRDACEWIGIALVCTKCYAARYDRDGAVARCGASMRNDRDDARALQASANSNDLLSAVDSLAEQLMCPDRSYIGSVHVPDGVACSVPKCMANKNSSTPMYAKEVLDDTLVGAESIRRIFVCKRHANDRRWIFAANMPLVHTMSAIKVCCIEQRSRVTCAEQRIDMLAHYMEKMSVSQTIGRSTIENKSLRARQVKEQKRREALLAELNAKSVSEN